MMKARVIPSQPEIAVLYHFKETQQEGAVLRELLSQHHIEACSLPEEALGQTVASFLAGEPPVAGKAGALSGAGDCIQRRCRPKAAGGFACLA